MTDEPKTGGIPHYVSPGDYTTCILCGMPHHLCEGNGGGAGWKRSPDHRFIADRAPTKPRRFR